MKIKTTKDEFADIVLIFLYERLKEENSLYNEEFKSILNSMEKRGMEVKLRDYYLDTDVITRNKYKFIKKTFEGTAISESIITISNGDKNE